MNRLKKESAFNRCNPQIPRSYYPFPHSRMLPHNPHADHHHAVGSFSCSGDTAHGLGGHGLGGHGLGGHGFGGHGLGGHGLGGHGR